MRILFRTALLAAMLCAPLIPGVAQDQPADKPATAEKPMSVSPRVRLQAAKSIYLKKLAGDDIPFTIITNAMTGWRYFVVNDPTKADLVIEVSAPDDPNAKDKDKDKGNDNGIRAGYNGRSVLGGGGSQSSSSNSVPTSDVKMIVRDARTHAVLWAGTEQAKDALRKNKQDENLEAAAQKLIQRFEQAVDPDSAKQPE